VPWVLVITKLLMIARPIIHTHTDTVAIKVKIVRRVYASSFSTLNGIPSGIFKLTSNVEMPIPNMMLKTGPAMHPVNAISPKPRRLIAIVAKESPTELPHESTVRPSSAVLIPLMSSYEVKMSTITFASM